VSDPSACVSYSILMVSDLAGRRQRFPAGEKATSANSLTHAPYLPLEVRQARLDALPQSSMLPYPTQVIMATGYADLLTHANGFDGERPGSEVSV